MLLELVDNALVNTAANKSLMSARQNAYNQVQSIPFPTSKDEDWRQISLKPLTSNNFVAAKSGDVTSIDIKNYILKEADASHIVIVNGFYRDDLSNVSGLPEGCFVGKLGDAPAHVVEAFEKHYSNVATYKSDAFVPFNTAMVRETVIVYIPKELKVEAPLQILYATDANENIFSNARTFIFAERHSDMTIVEDFVGKEESIYFMNAVTETVLSDESHVTHIKVQRESTKATHISRTASLLARGSNYNAYTISLGAALFRNEPMALVDSENAHATLDGLVIVNGNQVSDTHSIMDHLKENCTSHQLHKVIASGKGKSVFNGKIFVRKDSQLIDSFQENRNLLLSEKAEVFTKPQLEIFADDVKCSHGATIGQLSEDEMFYLQSRGLSKTTAQQLLTYGFALDVIENLPVASLREKLSHDVAELTTDSDVEVTYLES